MKIEGLYEESEECYREALKIRQYIITSHIIKLIFFRHIDGERHKETIVIMHNLAELLLVKGEKEKSEELRKEIASLIQQEYKPEAWSDEEVVSSLPSDVRLGQGKLVDHRPTFDDLDRENRKIAENLRNHGLG